MLALARAGSTDQAARRFRSTGSRRWSARTWRRCARGSSRTSRSGGRGEAQQAAARSAALYAAIHARTGGWYPAVNAATLSLIAGDPGRAERFARAALEALAERGDGSYYAAATEAEAELVLGRPEAAAEAVARAVALNEGDYGALSTTRRQLRLVCEATGADAAVLRRSPARASRTSAVTAWGRMVPGTLPAEAEAKVAPAIAAELEREPVGYGYGALAAGADILWAEALLAHGAELHVVLPVSLEEFVRASVAPAGAAWVERFHRCLDEATTIQYATDDALGSDDVLFRYGSELAMGLALLRARFLDARPASSPCGTAGRCARRGRDGDRHRNLEARRAADGGDRPGRTAVGGRRRHAGACSARGRGRCPRRSDVLRSRVAAERVVRAVLFADMRGFSKLADEQYVRFDETVMAAFARVLDGADGVASVNTWGDALAVVLDDVVAAANCALQLQEEMASLDLASAGLPEHLALRLGAHLGPVLPSFDPVRGVPTFTGSHVSRTARIEPVTPPGAIYVTSAFAAALLLGGRDELACDYVGHMPAAKDWGRLRMYRLRRR